MIHSGHRRVALFAPLLYFSVVSSPADSSGALWRQPQGVLAPGVMIEEIGGDEKHFTAAANRRQFASIVVEQDVVDAVLDCSNQTVSCRGEADNYAQHERLRAGGAYELKIKRRRSGGARELQNQSRRLARGHASRFAIRGRRKKFSEATRLLRRGKADSLPQAATIYRRGTRCGDGGVGRTSL